MKLLKLLCGIYLLTIIGCSEKFTHEYAEIYKEIEDLDSKEDKKSYLELIFEQDQNVRGSEGSEIMLKSGRDSKEYREYIQTQLDQDALNLVNIESYLSYYGHPKKSELGDIAAIAPWTVIHHAQGYKVRERNFEILYKAYLQGDIDDGAISLFLGRMYELKNRKRFRMENPYKSEDEINQLIEELGLEEEKASAEKG